MKRIYLSSIIENRHTRITEKNKTEQYIYLKNIAGLLELIQMGTLEIHTWGSNIVNVENPDMIVFDLDPGARHQTHLAVSHHGLSGFESLFNDRLSFDATARHHWARRDGALGADHIDEGPLLARCDGLGRDHCGV